MRVYKVNKAELINAIIVLVIWLGSLIAGVITNKMIFNGIYVGITITLVMKTIGLLPEKPVFETIEISEEEK